jgi:hypothetical protein
MSSPTIEKSGSFLSETTNVAKTSLYTPGAAGIYRINLGGVVDSFGFQTQATLYWNDGTEAQEQAIPTVNGNSNATTFYSAASQAISLSAEILQGSGTYSLYYSIEKC